MAEEKSKAIGVQTTGETKVGMERSLNGKGRFWELSSHNTSLLKKPVKYFIVIAEIKDVPSLGLVQLGHNTDHLVSSNSILWRHGS